MLHCLIPKIYIENICKIDVKKLKEEKNIKGIIIDLDNTMVPWGKKELSEDIISWIQKVKKNFIKICIVSNSHSGHIREIGEKLGIPFYSSRYKPAARPFKEALKIMKTNNLETAVIGDQIFTDILGGNRLNLFTILVKPLQGKDSIGTRIVYRTLENIFMESWIKSGKLKLIKDKWPA